MFHSWGLVTHFGGQAPLAHAWGRHWAEIQETGLAYAILNLCRSVSIALSQYNDQFQLSKMGHIAPTVKHTGQELGGKLCEIFAF